MKIWVFWIFGFFSICCCTAQTNFEWFSNIHFDSVKMPGYRHLFYQFCNTEDDSLIANGNLVFHHAKIASIGNCVFKQSVRDTIYTSCEISTRTKETSKNLLDFYTSHCKVGGISHSTSSSSQKVDVAFIDNKYYYFILTAVRKKKKYNLLILPITRYIP